MMRIQWIIVAAKTKTMIRIQPVNASVEPLLSAADVDGGSLGREVFIRCHHDLLQLTTDLLLPVEHASL